MNQVKIGKFMAMLRKEKELSQEQLAERLNVSRRTVSRWETGNNIPDLDMLMELSDFYSVELLEILDGERRTDKMEKEMEDTLLKVAEYENEGKKRSSIIVIVYSTIGVLALIVNFIINCIQMPDTFLTGFLQGATFATAFCAMILSIAYATGTMTKLFLFKKRLLERKGKQHEM